MFFALGMERVETRLRQGAVGETDVEEFLEQARPNEVKALFRHGISRAMDLFRVRRQSARSAPLAITAEEQTTEIILFPPDDQQTDIIPIPMGGQHGPTGNGRVRATRSRAS